ncbi:MAG: helix-turn-helix domain-containing protein [Candidatus Omnitrophota bacterium]
MKNIYLLKDLARLSGYSTHTLKYYLSLGLFHEIGRSPTTNFRYFDDTTIERLKRIKALRAEKLSIREIQGQIDL